MMQRNRSRIVVAIASVVSVSLLAACGSGEASGTGDGPILVGGSGPYSGPAAPFKGLIDGADSFFKQLARDGETIDGREIKFEALDDKTAPDQGVANVRQFISEGAVAIIGPQTSTLVPSAAVVSVQGQVPLIAAGTPSDLLASDFAYLGDISFVEEMAMEVQFFKDELKLPAGAKVSFAGADTSAGVATRDAFAAAAAEAGYEVVSSELIPSSASDVSAVSNAIRSARPDAIGLALPDATYTLLMKSLATAGLKDVPSVDYHAVSVGTLEALKNPNAYALRQWELTTADNPEMNKIRDAAEADGFLEEFNNLSGYLSAYMQGRVVYEALKQCGADCTGEKMADALASTSFEVPGVTFGEIGFSKDRHILVDSARIIRFDDKAGEVVVVSDAEYSAN